MSAHTPGPWETTWPKFNCSIESRGGQIATVYFGHTLGNEESVANANLIAAAGIFARAMLPDLRFWWYVAFIASVSFVANILISIVLKEWERG